MLTLTLYDGNEAEMLPLIVGFWLAHNGEHQTAEESRADLQAWTGPGHRLYAIRQDGAPVGLVHLGSRGGEIDWLEDLFVLPEFQNRGIGTWAVHAAEELVIAYSPSMYLEAAARNEAAIRLYRRLGYDCLNTVTLRRDFPGYDYEVVRTESLYGAPFEIRRRRD